MVALNTLYHDNEVLIAQTYAGSDEVFVDNMGLHVGDDPKVVLGRRAELLHALMPYGVDVITWVNQVHGDVVFDAKAVLNAPSADAQFTHEYHHALAIMTADCVPVAVFDKMGIACIHAGWQGLVQGIIPKTLAKFSSKTHAYIGACIGGASYELPLQMAQDIVAKCVAGGFVLMKEEELYQKVIVNCDGDKAYLDVGELARCQLVASGAVVLNETIECTYTGKFHSHRRATHQGVQAGRMAMVIARVL